ncbi:MAG: DUF1501 domain-containing protein [Planctomycetes bacterium]|nr:DUF1501 domain-containing protein [Planctomycetota bacterium]
MFPNRLGDLFSRREMLKSASCGFGFLALADMLTRAATAADSGNNLLAPKAPHFTPKAKRVIFMFMAGAPSHVDTFDYKPQLAIDDGKEGGGRGKGRKLMKSPFQFSQHGQSGLWFPETLPNLARHADELCLLNGMHTDLPAHGNATLMMHTGNFRFVRPSMGAWTLYGLGTDNTELPGFITLNGERGSAQNYASAFLPAAYQATSIQGTERNKSAVANIENPKLSESLQRRQLDLLASLNRERLEKDVVNPGLEGVIESYELAFKMEGALPQIMDISGETEATQKAYGIGIKGTANFGRQCLLARRFAEAGVRFIEIGVGGWDQHRDLKAKLTTNCHSIDKPIAALLTDLKERGLLQDTLLVWGGEFGRTPGAQNKDGRDHNATGFSMWMAGGGVKGGLRYGATDEHGVSAVEKRMHINDLHATMLHLLGIDHERLTYQYGGRAIRLTDLGGVVAKDILA